MRQYITQLWGVYGPISYKLSEMWLWEERTTLKVTEEVWLPLEDKKVKLMEKGVTGWSFWLFISSGLYQMSVPESAPVGSVVGRIWAKDRDIGVNAEMKYSIIDGDGRDTFDITTDPTNLFGIIIVKKVHRQTDKENINLYFNNLQVIHNIDHFWSFLLSKLILIRKQVFDIWYPDTNPKNAPLSQLQNSLQKSANFILT